MEAPVVMVGIDPVEVERRLRAGDVACPCGGVLAPWGHGRERHVRGVGALRPRRARCVCCLVTHVLLAVSCLLRRADSVDVIGAAWAWWARWAGRTGPHGGAFPVLAHPGGPGPGTVDPAARVQLHQQRRA